MESNYNNREFEQFVKRNADQYRMVPSDKVWKGINTALHTRRKWYGIGLGLLLLLTGVSVTWVMLSYPVPQKQSAAPAKLAIIQPVKPDQPVTTVSSTDINKVLLLNRFSLDDQERDADVVVNPANIASEIITESLPSIGSNIDIGLAIVPNRSAIDMPERTVQTSTVPRTDVMSMGLEPAFKLAPANERNDLKKTGGKLDLMSSQYNTSYLPLTIESVVNSYKPQKTRKKMSWQLYFAPTISYRKLTANKAYKSASPFADPINYPFASLTDVNKAVTHKPDMGLELGFATRYPLSKSVKLRGGLQFNINRYDIKAFVYNGEQATINLSGDNNSVTAWTHYRNYNGYKTDWLKNFYLSVSAPIGAELKVLGNNKTSLGIASTIQPTYILSDRAYLISTDYKNYASVPWLIRRVNVNTSFETFINYTSRNKTKWQVGPQVRYQVLSSFQNQYPVRENLFDFGLKLGVTLN